jgi:hypothetical protein
MAKYSMHCPVDECGHIMKSDVENEDDAVKDFIKQGDVHFLEAGHPKDSSMTPTMKDMMTRQYMKEVA